VLPSKTRPSPPRPSSDGTLSVVIAVSIRPGRHPALTRTGDPRVARGAYRREWDESDPRPDVDEGGAGV